MTSNAARASQLPHVVRVLVVARAVNRLGAFTLPFLALLLTQDHGWTTAAAGAMLTGFGLAAIPSRLLGGRLAETRGRRTTMVLGLTGCAVSQLALAGATSTAATVAAVLALGLCFEIYEPPSQALIADHVRLEDQPAAHGMMAAALAGSAVAAGVIATLLAGVDLRWLFVADAISCLGCALIVLRAVPPDVRGIPPRGASRALPAPPCGAIPVARRSAARPARGSDLLRRGLPPVDDRSPAEPGRARSAGLDPRGPPRGVGADDDRGNAGHASRAVPVLDPPDAASAWDT